MREVQPCTASAVQTDIVTELSPKDTFRKGLFAFAYLQNGSQVKPGLDAFPSLA